MINIVDIFDMRKMVDRLDEKVILILQVTHSIYAAFANFSAALQLLFILNFRLIITILDTIIGIKQPCIIISLVSHLEDSMVILCSYVLAIVFVVIVNVRELILVGVF